MSRKGTTGESRLWFLPTIASGTLAPTVAEFGGGTELTPSMRRDGFEAPKNGSTIDVSDASTRRNKSAPGNIDAGTATIRGYRDSVSGSDTFHTTLADDTAGYIVERPYGGSAAVAAAQKVNVYKGYVVSRSPQPWGDEARVDVVTWSIEASAEDIAVLA